MKISLTLNDKPLEIEVNPYEKLINILRRNQIYSVKLGCSPQSCGNCIVLLNDKAVPSCKIPVGIVRDSSIVTLEYFKERDVYQDIIKGFEQAGIHLCGYCNTGKIFAAYEILKTTTHPTREQIYNFIVHLDDCCTERETLINGIIYACANYYTKEKQRKNVK